MRQHLQITFVTLVASALLATMPVSALRGQPAAKRYNRLVIQGGILVDGLGTPARGPVDIVIEGDTVTDIVPVDPVSLGSYGSSFKRPVGDRIVDAQGMYVLPGFIEMHGHVPEGRVVPGTERGRGYAYRLWLAHGVTTVRDTGSGAGVALLHDEMQKSEAGEIISPRIIAYGGWPGYPRTGTGPMTREKARERLQEYKKAGAQGIKIFGPIYRDVLRTVVEEARSLDMRVAIHVAVGPADAADAARAGVTTIEHWYGIPDAAVPGVQRFPASYNFYDELDRFRYAGKLWKEADPGLLDRLMTLLIEQRVALSPTFVAYEPNRDLVRAQNLPWYSRYALPIMLEYWKPNPGHHGSYHYEWTTDDEVSWRENFRLWMNFVREFWRRGGHLALGSDPGGSFGLFGFTYVREMELYQEMGLDPVNIIEAATTANARALGLDRLAGGVRVGALADLVVVNGNPLKDLKVLYGTGIQKLGKAGKLESGGGVRFTIKEGIVYDARVLLNDVESMVQQARTSPTR